MLSQSVEKFLKLAAHQKTRPDAMIEAINEVVEALATCENLGEIDGAQTQLAQVLDGPTNEIGQMAAIASGFLVENGFPTLALRDAYARRLPLWIAGARRLVAALPEPDDANYEKRRAHHARENPADWDGFSRLENFYLPLVSVLSLDRTARDEFRVFLPDLELLQNHCESASYLVPILCVLDEEPLLVLEPSSGLGIEAKMSGIADNFQLQMLLQSEWEKLDGKTRVSPEITAMARGEGEQRLEKRVTGSWNLWNWPVLRTHRELPTDSSQNELWIWNEGRPSDIERFQNWRVVILGPPSYQRGWQAQRLFSRLSAHIEILRVLSPAEVAAWIGKLRAAP